MYVAMKSRLNLMNKVLLAVMVSLLCCSKLSQGGRIAKTRMPFKGTASGGTLVIGYTDRGRNAHFVSTNTFAGESAESVVNRLAEAIAYSNRIFDYSRTRREVDRDAIAARMALASTLELRAGPQFFLAGTETGLGIPKPPLFLSWSYDKQADKLQLKWTNPPGEYGEYDYIKINWRYNRIRPPGKYDSIDINWPYASTDKGGSVGFHGATLPTSYTIKKPADVNDLDLDVRLVVFRHGTPVDVLIANAIPLLNNAIPSDVAHIHVTGNGYCQEETNGIPFFAGIAPNWAAWSTAAKLDTAAFEQGDKYANLPIHLPAYYPTGLLTKPFYQVIKAPPQGVMHGVYRKFLGLTPGHTYRVTACLTTLEMDSVKQDWSLSLCAAHNGPDGRGLTVQQLAGLAPLPDGRTGPEAGRIAYYSQGNTTKRDYVMVFSGTKGAAPPESSHITLPSGVDTITVWLRFSCSDSKGKVGLSGVKLEDISANPNPKSLEQIVREEHQKQANLLKWIEKASRR